jgi:shikimate dehydrogenase
MNSSKRAACVIGYPAKHSRSPKLHNHWLERNSIDGDYRIEEIPPENFEAFLLNLSANGYVGANVTMPHKDEALRLSEPDEKATKIGAANTLWLDQGTLRSTNTDCDGFVGALDASSPEWDKQTSSAIVLGCGGAGRAVIYGLLERGISTVHVVNRTRAKTVALRDTYGSSVEPAHWEELPELLNGAKLLVNTTSLGMQGQPVLEIDLSKLASDAVVFDIVYVPLKTPLLAKAESGGLTTVNGLQMLLHQAVGGFNLWFGTHPEVTTELYDLMSADIPKN